MTGNVDTTGLLRGDRASYSRFEAAIVARIAELEAGDVHIDADDLAAVWLHEPEGTDLDLECIALITADRVTWQRRRRPVIDRTEHSDPTTTPRKAQP